MKPFNITPQFKPQRLEPAYREFEALPALLRAAAPYPNMVGLPGYEGYDMPNMPWFRTNFAHHEKLLEPSAAALFNNPLYIESAKHVFDAQIVRPYALIVNVMGATPNHPAHLDRPTFRGIDPDQATWLCGVMGLSGLFEPWAVRVAACISWVYDGQGGGFECWPNGSDKPSMREQGPFGNVAIMADNDYMLHRVCGFGTASQHVKGGACGPSSELYFDTKENRWLVLADDELQTEYDAKELRVSLLWKGLCFKDEADQRRYDDHSDDLDSATVIDRFMADLSQRGISVSYPSDMLDPSWIETLNAAYPLPNFNPA